MPKNIERVGAIGDGSGENEVFLLTSAPEHGPDDVADVAPDVSDMIAEPAKVMRIGRMISKLLDEVKDAPLDDASRIRLRGIYARSIAELKDGLSPELAAELTRITEPFGDGAAPSDPELRIAQAQLVGWLEGLFQGIQTALVAQQLAARSQLDQMRRVLPASASPEPHAQAAPTRTDPGMYL